MRRLISALSTAALLVLGLAVPAEAAVPALVDDPTVYVDPLVGSGGAGFTVPGAATPFGMTQVSPDTINPLAYTGYKYEDAAIRGFSLLHINAAGVPIAADLPFLPVTTPVTDPSDPTRFAVPFTHATEKAAAGSYDITLGNGVAVSLAATAHGGLERFTPPPGVAVTVLADVGRNAAGVNDSTVQVVAPDRLEGSSLVHWRGGDYTAYFSARFSSPATGTQTFVGSAVSSAATANGNGAGALLTFPAGQAVTMAIGVSLVDVAGARANLAAEIPAYDVSAAQTAARNAWRSELSRVRIGGGSESELRTFYTSLYRAFLNPDVDSDVDGRYTGADGQVHHSDRPHYENFSLWDTIRGENALLATLVPDRYRDMVASLSAYATESGQLPKWSFHSAHPDYMNGDPAIATVAEAVCRGIADDPELLYQQARSLAFDKRSSADIARGWSGGDAAGTLENADADFALALMAQRLGHTDDAATLLARSQTWRNLYKDGFLQPRNADGSWPAGYDPKMGTGYREGTGWQYIELAASPGLRQRVEEDLVVRQGGTPCAPAVTATASVVQNGLTVRYRCPAPIARVRVRIALLPDRCALRAAPLAQASTRPTANGRRGSACASASTRSTSTGCRRHCFAPRSSADAGEGIAHQHVDQPMPAEGRATEHPTRRLVADLSDDCRVDASG